MQRLSALPLFADASSLDISAPPASPDTVLITSDYTLASGDSLVLSGTPGLKVQVRQGADIAVQLDSGVQVSGAGDKLVGLVTTRSIHGGADIQVNSSFDVEATSAGTRVTGLLLQGENDTLDSSGNIIAGSEHGDAVAVILEGGSAEFDNFGGLYVLAGGSGVGVEGGTGAQTINYASIRVDAGQEAVGFLGAQGGGYFVNLGQVAVEAHKGESAIHGATPAAAGAALIGGFFGNAGLISVHAHGVAIGVELVDMTTASNGFGGVIEASASGQHALAIGVLMGSPFGPSGLFLNEGLVRADMAITSMAPAIDGQLATEIVGPDQVLNAGRIVGDIALGQGDDVVTNGDGSNPSLIKGEVDLGAGEDLYDSRFGRLIGHAWGGEGDDMLRGGRDGDHLSGDSALGVTGGDDLLAGMRGDDQLDGQAGDDILNGGKGADTLTGGLGSDTFVYNRAVDSPAGDTDRITDLDSSDHIDLSRIDADTGTGGDQAFHIVGAFSSAAGELTISYDAGAGETTFAGDVDGDGNADLVIVADGDHSGFTGFEL